MFTFVSNNLEEDQLLENFGTVLYALAMSEPKLFGPYSQEVLEWYIEKRTSTLLSKYNLYDQN